MMRTHYFFRLLLLILLFTAYPRLSLLADRAGGAKLKGTVIGTERCYDYDKNAASTTVNTPANAFDGDLSTFVATYDRSHTWVGLDLGQPYVITRVGWAGRAGGTGQARVVLGLFEGSNREDFMDAIPLYMITEKGQDGKVLYADVNVSRGFRYVRYCGPADSRCNIAEVEFYGVAGEGDDSQFYQITNLPTLSYHTYCGKEPYDKVTELESEMCIIYDGGTRIQEYPILARERGNGSRYELFKKRPYRVKFNDGKSHHMLKDSPLESPAKSKKWTLIPNWRDKSLMRNNIAFEMSRRLGMAYTPWIQNVDVIVNGEFKGNYQLCDQITVDPERVEISEMEPGDEEVPYITGGYLLEMTNAGGEQYHFSSSRGIPVDVKYPDDNDITAAQFSYIRNYFLEMESRLWASNYTDPVNGYRSRLDLESFLRLMLVGEFAGNTDALWSIYLYKEREDDLFHFGPVWDFDLCMDNDQRVYPANGKSNWLFNYGSAISGSREFFNRILSDPFAMTTLYDMWSNMRKSRLFSPESMIAYVDSLGQVMDESQKLNFTRWDNLGELLTLQQFAPGTYQGELDIIRNYLRNRISWIDNMLGYANIEDIDPTDSLFVINSAADLLALQQAVNEKGLTNLTVRLDADLDLTAVSSKLEPIGTSTRPYKGAFDGQNHILSGLTMQRSDNYVGLFGTLGAGATIRNLTIDSSCRIEGGNGVGLIGTVQGTGTITLSGLGNEGSVKAAGRMAGGILGSAGNAGTKLRISYCFASGSVSAQSEAAGLCGQLGSNAQVTRCYSSASVSGVSGSYSFAPNDGSKFTRCFSNHSTTQAGVTKVTASAVAEGSLCYRLNDGAAEDSEAHFYQNLGDDDHPVLQHHFEVIKQGNMYINDNTFLLSSPQDVLDFAQMVNSGLRNINGIVTGDLDFEGVSVTPIGTAQYPFIGTFDGQMHTISNLVIKTSRDYTGLFGIVSGGATIRNLILDASCSISGAAFVGLIGGSNGSGRVTMECLGNEGSVTASAQNAGGIFGCNMHAAATPVFLNCYVTGPVKGARESGQLTGYAGNGQATNCYCSGKVEGVYYKDMSDAMLRGGPKSSNCYSIYADKNAKVITSEQVASGELCYLLNQKSSQAETVWYQTLGSDDHPVFDAMHSPVLLASDGTYYNEGSLVEPIPSPAGQYEAYSLQGTRISRNQRGIHIVRTGAGKTYKVLVK